MTLQERKDNLLKHSATEVRNSRTLFAEFVFIYTAEGGNKRDCMSCNFKSVFIRWQRANSVEGIKKKQQMASNTFKLKNPKEQIYVPGGAGTITESSPDELVVSFLNQEKGKNKDARINRFFAQIPESMREKPKAAKKQEERKEVKKTAPKKRASNKK